MKKLERTSYTTQTTSTTRGEGENDAAQKYLSPEEEKVVRMLHGLSEKDDAELAFAVGASDDSRLRLALMEACNIAELEGKVPAIDGSDPAVLERIVARYREYG